MSAKQYTFWSYNKSIFYIVRFDGNPFMPLQKGKQKDVRISNFTLLLAVFKWHHGSERVNTGTRTSHSGAHLFTSPSEVGVVVEVEQRFGGSSRREAPKTKDEDSTVHKPPWFKTVCQLERKQTVCQLERKQTVCQLASWKENKQYAS